ncbi:MAG: TIR domain-containing protein [Hydrogenophaga sp.]|nr:TIR domain-containing protein [Hydrogenophaga sp.]MDP2405902.1 TIR domain-containing protein [Hydrogenophaga sp.]MDZ4174859.1 TIR domain-containing protein [Hydrogenophaga sp.]
MKLQTPDKIRKWIDEQLVGTTVTVVLIGNETSTRPYVKYEIERSVARGNGLLGVYIHNMKDMEGQTDAKGSNPLPAGYKTYDWVNDDGRNNIGALCEGRGALIWSGADTAATPACGEAAGSWHGRGTTLRGYSAAFEGIDWRCAPEISCSFLTFHITMADYRFTAYSRRVVSPPRTAAPSLKRVLTARSSAGRQRLLPAANLGPTHRMRYQAVVGATPIIHRIGVGMQLIQWQPN